MKINRFQKEYGIGHKTLFQIVNDYIRENDIEDKLIVTTDDKDYTVDEIEIDIENGDFSSAYIKAETLYWDSSWSSEGKKKWNSTRKAVIKQIQEAEINETGTITYKSNWLSDIFN